MNPLRPTIPPPPKTARYDVQWRECVTGDTWEKLSKEFYYTETAAAALREFNRTYERASDSMRRDGTITPKDRVYIPPVDILERHGLIAPPAKTP